MDQWEPNLERITKQKWCSILGGVLDWMFFFFKCQQLVSTWITNSIITKNNMGQKWVSIHCGRCSWSDVLLFQTSVNYSVHGWQTVLFSKTTQIRSGVPLWEGFLIGCSSFSNINKTQYMNTMFGLVVVLLCCCVVVLLCCCVVVSLCCCVIVSLCCCVVVLL